MMPDVKVNRSLWTGHQPMCYGLNGHYSYTNGSLNFCFSLIGLFISSNKQNGYCVYRSRYTNHWNPRLILKSFPERKQLF